MRLFILSLAILFSIKTVANIAPQERPQGGTLSLALSAEPTTLNPFTHTDAYGPEVFGYGIESLLTHDLDTYDWKPALADKWEISKDHKIFTFHLRDDLKWSDGQPLTVEDVKFSFDAIKDKRYKALTLMPYFEGIDRCEIVDPHTVKFYAKTNYFQNFDVVATNSVLPKHIYGDPEAKVNKTFMGSGAYMLDTYEKGRRITLKRNPLWWGWKDPKQKGENNFDKISFRFVDSPQVTLEMLKKGDINFMGLQPEQFVQDTKGPEWGKTLIKVKTHNDGPKGYNWVGFNLKNPILKDKQVRLALAHLMNRDLMIKKFNFGMYEKTKGPSMLPEYTPPTLKAIEFNPKKALQILRDDGWADTDKKGILSKTIDGKKYDLRFEILIATDVWSRYLTVFKEDAKQVGVDISIKQIEWNTFTKLLDEGKFDMITLAWSGGDIQWDPKQIWHSSSQGGGSNVIGYNNPEVDKLIDQARTTWDRKKRAKLLQKVNELIANDVPYIFMFDPIYTLYAHRSELQKPKDTFKYGVGTSYWWIKK